MSKINKIFRKIRNNDFNAESLKNPELVTKEINRLNSLFDEINSIPQYIKLKDKVANEGFWYKRAQRKIGEYRRVETVLSNRIKSISQAAVIASAENKQQNNSQKFKSIDKSSPFASVVKEIIHSPCPKTEPGEPASE